VIARTDPKARVARVLRVLPGASTSPAEIETEAGARFVLKFSGAGPGPYGLLVEYLGLAIARAFGAPVPAARPLWLAADFPWMAGTDEFDALVQRSPGWNLGIDWIAEARVVRIEEALSCAAPVLETIARSDCLLLNMDRGADNPNMLLTPAGFFTVDYDACLYLTRALGGARPPEPALPAGHFLRARFPRPRKRPLPTLDFPALLAEVPEPWIAATGASRAVIAAALESYARAWADQPE
jgi:hypothetical protein